MRWAKVKQLKYAISNTNGILVLQNLKKKFFIYTYIHKHKSLLIK